MNEIYIIVAIICSLIITVILTKQLISRNLEQQKALLQQSINQQQLQIQQLRQEVMAHQSERSEALLLQINALREANDNRMLSLRDTVDQKLFNLQQSNEQNLQLIRHTVDEKLEQTLGKRLGSSFALVSENLEQVHRGLGEMQNLAKGVGDLKKVLSNVKNRGILGEMQLERLLGDMLSPYQYRSNIAVNPQHNWRVEFAICLPGQDENQPLYLPIDAKFPLSDYELLLNAEEAGDGEAMLIAGKNLETRIKAFAKDISEKYICPPYTTDFAIMFLPLEGLYSELARRPALLEILQKQYHIIPAGPVSLAALLNSLQMGFRSLAIEAHAQEVWHILANVKSGFNDFGLLLQKTQKKLQEASNSIDNAARKSRSIERSLRRVGEEQSESDLQLTNEDLE